MLEHLWRDDAIFFLKECYRILKNEGIIRLCIPDWEELRNHQTFENSLFARNKSNLRLSHKWCWSYKELREMMEKIGYKKISKYDFQEGNFPDLNRIEIRRGLIVQGKNNGIRTAIANKTARVLANKSSSGKSMG